MQVEELAVLHVPAGHVLQLDAPAAENWPAKHELQPDAPAAENWPAEHNWQVETAGAAIRGENVPATQLTHEFPFVDGALEDHVPALQL